jgi:dTDP-4-amino-4,6-dideoxygalactose transaminase
MIPLFNIPNYIIDTSKFSNLLHDKVVTSFERNFAEYVGANYACSINSATNALFLCLSRSNYETINIPSIIPPVVLNAIIRSGNHIEFNDNVDWVGNSYVLHKYYDFKIIDSAQKVCRDQFTIEGNDEDLMVFSFYPTKPIGSSDGGMIVSNDRAKIERLRTLTMNGMSTDVNNWDRTIQMAGWKMYMNSLQAYIANENLKLYDDKLNRLNDIREIYNTEFGLENTSDHLYRIRVADNKQAMTELGDYGIASGIHYACMHNHKVYSTGDKCPKSEIESTTTLSIPFNEALQDDEISYIINKVKQL